MKLLNSSLFMKVLASSAMWTSLSIATLPLAAGADPLPERDVKPAPHVAAPYTLPWQLRSIMAANVARLDSAVAFYSDKNGNTGGLSVASVFTGAYKLIPDLAILTRVGMVKNAPPESASGATSFLNPLLGVLYSRSLSSEFRIGLFLGFTVPVGSGGGNTPDLSVQASHSAGVLARSAMDNALFVTNYLAVIPGLDLAYISNGLTVQMEATLLQLTRVRGEQIDKDTSRTNFTSGVAVGYSFAPLVSVMGELRYQRWLSNATVSAAASPAIDNLSFAIGPRFNAQIGTTTFKPGIAYAQGLSGPMANGNYTYPTHSDRVIFIDVPVAF